MPLITLSLRPGKSTQYKSAIFDAIHTALVASGVPPTDRFQRVLELEADNFRFDATYPDAERPRNEDFLLIEILWSVGRSVKIKRKILGDILTALAKSPGLDPENVMVCFTETSWENWSFAGGRQIHA